MPKTIDEACDFIADWCQQTGSYAGQPLASGIAVPDCVVRLNARVGDLWRSVKRLPGPILQHATPFLGLLGGQDKILNPNGYARDENGIVPFVWENQGVWGYGFDPDDVDHRLVSGDWCDGLRGDFETKWRRVGAKHEDALVCSLLIACASAHYWARELKMLGHDVRLMPARDVRAYVRASPGSPRAAPAPGRRRW